VHEHGAALDVAQELIAEAVALMGAFDEAGDVGDDEGLVVVGADDAEIRDERGERGVPSSFSRGSRAPAA